VYSGVIVAEMCRFDDQSLRILKSPSDVHLLPPDQADDRDDPEQAGSHHCEDTGLRAEPHQPIRGPEKAGQVRFW